MSEPTTTTRSLEERLAAPAEAWRPQPGDKLFGTVVEIGERDGDYGMYPIVVVATDSGEELAFHAFRTVAKSELAKQRPQVGDRIGIGYFGKPDGKSYELYRVVVERDEPPASVDWDRHAADAETELAAAESPPPLLSDADIPVDPDAEDIPF